MSELHLQRQFMSLIAVQRTAAWWSRAHLHQLGADRNDLSLVKVGVFLPPKKIFSCYFAFRKDITTQVIHHSLYWLLIMRDSRIWNLADKMTSDSISSRNRILALLVLNNRKHEVLIRQLWD